jgi:hypothetical protein
MVLSNLLMFCIENQVHWRIKVKRWFFSVFLSFHLQESENIISCTISPQNNQHHIKQTLNLKSTRLFIFIKTNNRLVVGPWCNIGQWTLQGHEIKLELNSECKNPWLARITCQEITSHTVFKHDVTLIQVEMILPLRLF